MHGTIAVRSSFFGFLVMFLVPSSLYAWGKTGHEIVAILAEQRLEPEVRKEVAALLDEMTFVEASMWADRVRSKETAPWHYVNIPIEAEAYEPTVHCAKGQCVIAQIERFRAVLANPTAGFKKRQKALKYLIHFIADLHQPLHAGDNHDRGGNDVVVEFLGQTMDPYRKKPWNLHAVWDSGLIDTRQTDAQQYAVRLRDDLTAAEIARYEGGSVVDWAMESHRVAKEHVYQLPEDSRLGEEYVKASVSVVDHQLAKAGVRLARMLNESLTKRPTATGPSMDTSSRETMAVIVSLTPAPFSGAPRCEP